MTLDSNRRVALAVTALITLLVVGLPAWRTGLLDALVAGDLPALAGPLEAMAAFLTPFLSFVAIFAIVSVGLNVQWGYTGIFNFGVVGFFMVGAYTAAIITKQPASSEYVQYVGGYRDVLTLPFLDSGEWLPFLVAIVAAGVASGLLGLLLALPTLRLRDDYLAIALIGVAEVLRRITIEQEELVNGTRGLTGIPKPLNGWFEQGVDQYVFLAITVLALVLIHVLLERGIRSPWGRVLRAIRDEEDTVAASGKNVFAFRVQGFVLGAVIIGMGGALFAFHQASISPDTFTHFFGTFIIWAMLIVGGSGNNLGAVLGAFIIWGFWSITLQVQGVGGLPPILAGRVFFLRDLLIGLLIVVVLLVMPQGLLPEEARVSRWLEERVRGMGG